MTATEYQKACQRTKSSICLSISGMARHEDLIHACMGINTESGELTDALKKFLFYCKPLDMVNVVEEIGDLLWYIAILCEYTGLSMEEIMEKNINKLKVRYPLKFSTDNANNRNLEAERNSLEKKDSHHDMHPL
jgi:NTP pyrophosphatase (non-canonical NTP hydrolase)